MQLQNWNCRAAAAKFGNTEMKSSISFLKKNETLQTLAAAVAALLVLTASSSFILLLEEHVVKVVPRCLAFVVLNAVILSLIFTERGPPKNVYFSVEHQLHQLLNYDDEDDRPVMIRRVQSDCGGRKKNHHYEYENNTEGKLSANILSKCNSMDIISREMDPSELQERSEEFIAQTLKRWLEEKKMEAVD